MPLTFGSLFAGIGGIDLGFERAGMRCLWQVETDAYCRKVLAKHWPDVERFEDVKDVGKHNLKPVDVIAGGFPCQPHSVAGQRRGAEDDRNLWPEYRRIIAELKPTYVIGENVPGIITTYLDTVLSDLESEGYTIATFNLPACGFDAQHKRERIFIVAYATSGRLQRGRFSVSGAKSKGSGLFAKSTRSGNGKCKVVANANGLNGRPGAERQNGAQAGYNGETLPNAGGAGWQELNVATVASQTGYRSRRTAEAGRKWAVEPGVGRVANGVPNRVDRIKALGNAVVPQVSEFVASLVVRHHITSHCTGAPNLDFAAQG